MYKIATLNNISHKGLDMFSENYQLVEDISVAEGIIVRSQDMRNMTFSKDLMAIARAGVGIANIPIEKCSEEGIVVFNTPGANANAVKEMVLAGLLIAARDIIGGAIWSKTLTEDIGKQVEKNKSKFAGNELKGKTLGVIGLGYAGVMVANATSALGMEVIGYDPYLSIKAALGLSRRVEFSNDMDTLLSKCDYLTLHVPYDRETKKLINEDKFKHMKDGVTILNFSRDKIVNNHDILDAIEAGKVKRYITDFPNESLIENPNVICIPHLGASTEESQDNCASMAVEQIMDYFENGNITNSVNFPDCSLGICSVAGRIAVLNKNIPSMLGKITGILAEMNVNISDLINRSVGAYAYNLIDIDSKIDKEELIQRLTVDGIISIRILT